MKKSLKKIIAYAMMTIIFDISLCVYIGKHFFWQGQRNFIAVTFVTVLAVMAVLYFLFCLVDKADEQYKVQFGPFPNEPSLPELLCEDSDKNNEDEIRFDKPYLRLRK